MLRIQNNNKSFKRLFSLQIWSASQETMQSRAKGTTGTGIEQNQMLKLDIPDQKEINSISIGRRHTGIVADNKLYVFGRSVTNSVQQMSQSGALGLGYDTKVVKTPQQVEVKDQNGKEMEIKDIACGFNYSTLITTDNKLYSCGYCGDSKSNRTFYDWLFSQKLSTVGFTLDQIPHLDDSARKYSIIPQFTQIPAVAEIDFVSVDGGEYQTIARDSNNKLWQWGRGEHGVFGNGGTANMVNPEVSEFFQQQEVEKQVCGTNHNLVQTSDQRFQTQGRNDWGQLALSSSLGLDMQECVSIPQQIVNLRKRLDTDYALSDSPMDQFEIKHLATSENLSVLVDNHNKVFISGRKVYAEFSEVLQWDNEVDKVQDLPNPIVEVCAGLNFILLIDSERQVYTFGNFNMPGKKQKLNSLYLNKLDVNNFKRAWSKYKSVIVETQD